MPQRTLRIAATAVVGLEGLAVLVLAAVQIAEIAAGRAGHLPTAIALVVLTVAMGAGVVAFAVGIARGASWGPSGAVVMQLMVLAVALGAATGVYADPVIALAIAAPAVVALVLLVLLTRSLRPPRAPEA